MADNKEKTTTEERTGMSADEMEKLTSTLLQKVDAGVSEMQRKLDEEFRAGTHPAVQRVKDLELQLREAEEKSKEVIEKNQEELRLIQVEMEGLRGGMSAQRIAPELKPGDPGYNPDFKRHFVRDLPAAREMIRAINGRGGGPPQNGGTRAIDSTVLASGGQLSEEVADTFIDNVIAQQQTLSRIVTRRMMSPQGRIDELRVAARTMRSATEGSAPSASDAITTDKRSLVTTEVIWAEDLTLTFLEDNIEKRNAEAHIGRILATQFGNDLNDLAWNGIAGDMDPFIKINDGFIELINDSVVAAGSFDATDVTVTSETTATGVMQSMMQGMPDKFLGLLNHAYWTNVTFAQNYANEVSARETGLGDNVLVNGFPALRYFGRPVIPETHIPVITGTPNVGQAYLTPASNMVFGIQRNITVDSEWQPRSRVVEYTLTARIDYQIATMHAVVRANDIIAALVE